MSNIEKARHQFDEAVEKVELKEYLAQHPDFKATCGNCCRKSTMNLQVLCDHTGTDDTAACDDWIPGPMTKEELSAFLGFEYDSDIPRLDSVVKIKDEDHTADAKDECDSWEPFSDPETADAEYKAIQLGTLANINLLLSVWFCNNNGCGCAACLFGAAGLNCPRHQVIEVIKKLEEQKCFSTNSAIS